MAKMMGKRGGRFGITSGLYALVADGLKAYQSDVAASEEKLAPSPVELSHACGGRPSPSRRHPSAGGLASSNRTSRAAVYRMVALAYRNVKIPPARIKRA